MRRRTKLLLSGIVLALLVLTMWLAVPPAEPGQVLTFGVDGTRQGKHLGAYQFVPSDPVTGFPDNFIAVASFTNNTRVPLLLLPSLVEWDQGSGRKINVEVTWGRLPQLRLPPKAVAELPISPEPTYPNPEPQKQKLRFKIDYTEDAGPIRRGISSVVGKMLATLMPKQPADWLLRHGLVDGRLYGQFESPWLSYPFEAPAPH